LRSIGNQKSWSNDWEEKEASRTTTKNQGISKFVGIEQQKIQIELLLQQPNIIVGFPHLGHPQKHDKILSSAPVKNESLFLLGIQI
jgi:hypothetical protein